MADSSQATPAERVRERRYRGLAIALMLVFPLVYAARLVTTSELDFRQAQPRFTQLILITAGVWPDGRLPATEARARSASIEQTYAPARSSIGSAVSLWTGRYPMSHGVRGAEQRLPAGTWTLASAAQSVGTRTAAFLQEPHVSSSGLEGFDRVVEDAELSNDRAIELLAEELNARPNERVCVWIHFAKPSASELARLREFLFSEEFEADRSHECLIIQTAFRSRQTESPDARARVPLFVELPGGTAARIGSTGSASLVDLPGALCELLTLPRPSTGQPALQSHGEDLWRNLNGGGSFPWLFLESDTGDVLRFGRTRVARRPDGSLKAEQTALPRSDTGFRPAPPELAVQMHAQYEELVRQLAD